MLEPLAWRDAASYRVYFDCDGAGAVAATQANATDKDVADTVVPVATARADATETVVVDATDTDVATDTVEQQARTSWTLDRLLSPIDMDELLEAYGRVVQAQHRAVAGSMLVKMVGRSLPGLWKLLSVHNVRVRFELPQATLILAKTDTTVSLHVPADACTPLPQLPGERAAARDEWLRSMIDGCLRPLLEAVSFRSGLSKAILWENLFIYLHHAYGEWMRDATEGDGGSVAERSAAGSGDTGRSVTGEGAAEHDTADDGGVTRHSAADDGIGSGGGDSSGGGGVDGDSGCADEQQSAARGESCADTRRSDGAASADTDLIRIAGDYAALTREGSPFHLPSASFANPLHPGRELRIRRTCCLQHALPSGRSCYSCPHLCDAKRKEIYLSKK